MGRLHRFLRRLRWVSLSVDRSLWNVAELFGLDQRVASFFLAVNDAQFEAATLAGIFRKMEKYSICYGFSNL